ncbi:MAG: VanZ family protein, partial [Pseudomonadota bacterium]
VRDEIGVSWAEVRYPLPRDPAKRSRDFLASGIMSSQDVAVGDENWHVALFGVFFYDDAGQRIQGAGVTVQALAGDSAPLRHERLFKAPDNATEFGVTLRLFDTTGATRLSDVEASMVRPWPNFKNVMLALAAVWAAFSLAVLFALAERRCLLLASIPLGVIAAILVGVSLPGEHLQALLVPLYKVIKHSPIPFDSFGIGSTAKLGHAVAFAALTFFALAIRNRLGATLFGIALFVVVLAVATESGQLFLTGRSGRMVDIAIDIGGALAGAALFLIVAVLLWPFRRRSEPS